MSACYDISRRSLLTGGTCFAAWSCLPVLPSLAGTADPRLLVVMLRGALDGLATVMPVGDPHFMARREAFMEDVAEAGAILPLDGFFALSPHLPTLNRLYSKGDALLLHAIASPYRDRSHFDGQDVVETGLPGVGSTQSGWLNRLVETLPGGQRTAASNGVFVGASTPVIMRGAAPVASFALTQTNDQTADTTERLEKLYAHTDPQLASAWQQGQSLASMAAMGALGNENDNSRDAMRPFAMAAGLMAKPDGPRVAAMSIDGWDTHANARPGTGLMAQRLKTLDRFVATIEESLAPVWQDTAVVIVTEFGRTVDVNGTHGTDHGTATSAMVLGGAVAGGRVLADWPGLAENQLLARRDLRPTADLRSLFKGLVAPRFAVNTATLDDVVFPQSSHAAALPGLYRTA